MDAVSLNVGSLATQIAYIDTMHTTIGSFSADWEIKGVPLLGELDRIGTDGGSVGLHFESYALACHYQVHISREGFRHACARFRRTCLMVTCVRTAYCLRVESPCAWK